MSKAKLRLRVGALLAAATIVGGGAVAMAGIPAGASNRQVTAAGSFTTYQLMHALFPTSLNDLLPGGTTSHQRIIATTALCASQTPNTKVYAVKFTTSAKHPTGAPNGSGAGKNYLKKTEETTTKLTQKGCVTIGRSSSPPTPKTVSTHFDYYAYALDGVSIMIGTNAGGSVESPTAISLQQVKNIYACWKLTLPGTTPATHTVTTWKEAGLGTSNTTINRFWPQPGSGTRAVYTTILGFTPTKKTTVKHCATPAPTSFSAVTVGGTSKSVVNEENTESGLIYATKVQHKSVKNDIFVYSGGKFVSQWNNQTTYGATKNNRIDQKTIGNFTPKNLELAAIRERKATGATTPKGTPESFVKLTAVKTKGHRTNHVASVNAAAVTEANEWYTHIPSNSDSGAQSLARVPGVRYVYNVCDTALPSYDTCKAMVGFDNQTVAYTKSLIVATQGQGFKSRLCAGNEAATIVANGFLPLGPTGGPAGSDIPHATCREFPGASYPGLATSPKSWVANTWVNPTK